MRSSNKSYTTIGLMSLTLVLSITACTSSDSNADTAAPSASATANKSPTAAPAPAPPTTEAPAAFPTPAPAPADPAPTQNPFINPQPGTESFVITAEDAIDIITEYHDNNPDLQYDVRDNGDGTFDVTVTSLSIVAQGGDGNAGTYLVLPDRDFVLK